MDLSLGKFKHSQLFYALRRRRYEEIKNSRKAVLLTFSGFIVI